MESLNYSLVIVKSSGMFQLTYSNGDQGGMLTERVVS